MITHPTRTAPNTADMRRRPKEPTDDMVQCPACRGQGVVKKWSGDHSPDRDCTYCDAVGGVTEDRFHTYHDRG